MGTLDISMINNQYLNNDNNITSDQMKPYGLSKTEKSDETKAVENKIHNSAVNVSISMESIKVF